MLYWGMVVIFLVFLIYGIKECVEWGGIGDIVVNLILGVIGGAVYGVILLLLTLALPVTHHFSYSFDIYALKDNNSLKGSFYLGAGTVEGTQVYSYIRKVEGGKQIDTIDIDKGILYEGAHEPHISVYEPELKHRWSKLLFGDMFIGENKYKIYIPDNSVVNEYDVDLE